MRHVFQAKSAMTWHYIFVKPNPRLLKYQLLTAHTHAATVEDQPRNHGSRRKKIEKRNCKVRGHQAAKPCKHNPACSPKNRFTINGLTVVHGRLVRRLLRLIGA